MYFRKYMSLIAVIGIVSLMGDIGKLATTAALARARDQTFWPQCRRSYTYGDVIDRPHWAASVQFCRAGRPDSRQTNTTKPCAQDQ
jgi:hypothetical protein